MPPSDPSDWRSSERVDVLSGLTVLDAASGEVPGRLADLSLGGFRLHSPRPIAVGTPLELSIELPAGWGLGQKLDLRAECRWMRAEVKGPGFVNGFELEAGCAASVRPTLTEILRKL